MTTAEAASREESCDTQVLEVMCASCEGLERCSEIWRFYRELTGLFVRAFTSVAGERARAETDATRLRVWLHREAIGATLDALAANRQLFRGTITAAKYQACRRALFLLARRQKGISEKDDQTTRFVIRSFVIPASLRVRVETVNLLVEFARERKGSDDAPRITENKRLRQLYATKAKKLAGRELRARDFDVVAGYHSSRPRERWEAERGCSEQVRKRMVEVLQMNPHEFLRILDQKKANDGRIGRSKSHSDA